MDTQNFRGDMSSPYHTLPINDASFWSMLPGADNPSAPQTLAERAETAATRCGGMGCAQALLTSYADLVGLTGRGAANLALGFGHGMGRQLTCGAVTGMLMLAGLGGKGEKCGNLFDEFELRMGSSSCDYFLEKNCGHSQCAQLVRCAGELLNQHVFGSGSEIRRPDKAACACSR